MRQEDYSDRSLLEIGNVVVLLSLDEQGRITRWNDCATRKFGHTRSEAIGKPLANFLETKKNSTSEKELVQMLQKSMGVDHSEIKEFTGLKKNGSRFPLELELRAQQTISGPVYTVVMVDISRRRALEVDLHKKSTSLDLLLYQCNHNLKAPYFFAQGLIKLIKKEPLGHEASKLIGMLESSLNGGKQLLEDLTTISILTEAYQLDETVDFAQMFEELSIGCGACPVFKDLKLEFDYDTVYPFKSNKTLIERLLNAAVRFVNRYTYGEDIRDKRHLKIGVQTTPKGASIAMTFNHLIHDLALQEHGEVFRPNQGEDVSQVNMSYYLMNSILELLNGSLTITATETNCSEIQISIPNPKPDKPYEEHRTYRIDRRQQNNPLFKQASDQVF